MRSLVAFSSVAALILLSLWPAHAQQQPYRGATNVVAVYATVKDRDGRIVPNLEQQDFEVRDNGTVRPIELFSSDVQPLSVAILLDRSGSMMGHAEVVEHGAEKFVEHLLPADHARIGDFSRYIRFHPNEFTNDKDLLIDVLRNNLQSNLNGPSPVWSALVRAINVVSAQQGRRVVLVFTDGKDEPAYDQDRTKFQAVKDHAIENEVMIYAIAVPAQVVGAGAIVMGRQYGGGTKYEPPNKQLRELADATGGGHLPFDWAQNLDVIFTRVADELHRQYLIGFSPVRLDGKVHQISVNSKKSGLTVRARQSYVAEGQ